MVWRRSRRFHTSNAAELVVNMSAWRALLPRIVPDLKRRFPWAEVLFLLDAGFSGPQLFALLDELKVSYLVAMPQNPAPVKIAARHLHAVRSIA